MRCHRVASGLWIFVVVLLAGGARAVAEEAAPADDKVRLVLRDGSQLVGRIVSESATDLRFVTADGIEIDVPRSLVDVQERADAPVPATGSAGAPARSEPILRRSDPNYSRLMFSPTGRPLRKGDGYFSSHYVLFPGFAYGLTDHISLAGGVSVIPGLRFREQAYYVSPKVGFEVSKELALSTGVLYASAGEANGEGLGIAYAVGTYGHPDKSLSIGLGYADIVGDGDLDGSAILMLGGTWRFSKSIALITENWLFANVDLSSQPFCLGLRFFGERLSADVGVILVGDALRDGVPIPWLSFSYHFGRSAERSPVPAIARAGARPEPMAAGLLRRPLR